MASLNLNSGSLDLNKDSTSTPKISAFGAALLFPECDCEELPAIFAPFPAQPVPVPFDDALMPDPGSDSAGGGPPLMFDLDSPQIVPIGQRWDEMDWTTTQSSVVADGYDPADAEIEELNDYVILNFTNLKSDSVYVMKEILKLEHEIVWTTDPTKSEVDGSRRLDYNCNSNGQGQHAGGGACDTAKEVKHSKGKMRKQLKKRLDERDKTNKLKPRMSSTKKLRKVTGKLHHDSRERPNRDMAVDMSDVSSDPPRPFKCKFPGCLKAFKTDVTRRGHHYRIHRMLINGKAKAQKAV